MFHLLAVTIVLMFTLFCHETVGVSLSIDSFEQTLGQDIMEMDLRVRKFNRTSTVINGTIHLRQEATNALQVS